MSEPAGGSPQLSRTGGGSAARLGALLAFGLLIGAVAIAVADRPADIPPPPSVRAVVPSPAPLATDSPAASAATPTPLANALDRGTGWPRDPRRPVPAFFDAALLNHDRTLHRVRLDGRGGERSVRLAIPRTLWLQTPRLQLRWSDGHPRGRRESLVVVRLTLGEPSELGLPIRLTSGGVRLPQEMAGGRHWRYTIGLERSHAFSDPMEWVATIRLERMTGRPTRPPSDEPEAGED